MEPILYPGSPVPEDEEADSIEAERSRIETEISEEYKKGLKELHERVNKLLPGKTYGPGFPD